jgi:hypothetical protein
MRMVLWVRYAKDESYFMKCVPYSHNTERTWEIYVKPVRKFATDLFVIHGILTYEGVSKSFRTESIMKYVLATINTYWEARQGVIAANLTRLTHKIVIQVHIMVESCTICCSRSRRPVRKLLDTTSYFYMLLDFTPITEYYKRDVLKCSGSLCFCIHFVFLIFIFVGWVSSFL